MIDRLVVLGAAGDLNARFLLPGLAAGSRIVLCLAAMEPPLSLGERDLRDRKIDVLRSVRPLTGEDVVRRTRRARYLAGRVGGRRVPAYIDEDGVDPQSRTETFAEVELHLESRRWSGTTFRLRTGKALEKDRKEVAVRFRPVPHLPFGHTGEALMAGPRSRHVRLVRRSRAAPALPGRLPRPGPRGRRGLTPPTPCAGGRAAACATAHSLAAGDRETFQKSA